MAEDLSIQERIARRRAARAAAENGQEQPEEKPKRTARTIEQPEPVVEQPTVEEPVVEQPRLRRTRLAEPVAPPENAVPVDEAPVRPRRRIVTPEELSAEEKEALVPVEQQVALPEPVVEQISIEPIRAERVKEQAMNASQALIIGLLEHMRAGEQLLITRDNENLWSIVLPTSVVGNYVVKTTVAGTHKIEQKVERRVRTSGKLPANFEDSLRSPEYEKWKSDWRAMTLEQKEALAKKVGATFPDPKMNEKLYNMRLAMAVQEKMGLMKYKPQYSTVKAREEAKEKALQGLEW